jgi:hypothetical protein
MAKIPSAADFGARPAPNTLAPVSYDSGGAAPARALQRAGQVLSRIGERAQEQEDEAAFHEAQAKANEWEAENVHDAEKGAKAKRGKDALTLDKELPESFDRFRDSLMTGLTSNRQRQVVGRMLEGRRAQLQQWTSEYVGRQRDEYEEGSYQAAKQTAVQRVALNPALADQELRTLRVATLARARRRGDAPEVIDAEVSALDSDFQSAVLDSHLGAEQYAQAREHFSKVADRLTPEARAKYKKAVDEGGLRLDSQQKADEIMAGAKSRADALAAAKKIKDPELRDATETRVDREWSNREQAQTEAEKSAFSDTVKLIVAGSATSRDDIPVAQWNTMTGPQQHDALELMRKKAKGDDAVTDFGVYYELDQMAAENPQKFGELDLTLYAPHLDKTDREKVSALQRAVKSGQIAGFKGQREVREELVNDFYQKAKNKTPEADALRRRFDEAVQVHIDTKGKRPDINELRTIREGLVKDVMLKDRWGPFNDERKVYEIGLEDVPDADRKEIEAALKKRGRTVTEQAIVELYLKGRE